MTRLGALLAAGAVFAMAPSVAQTIGTCSRGGGTANQPQPVWILFDQDSARARSLALPGSTRSPVSPSETSSARDPILDAMTGTPLA